jgi:hypothetical protein
MFSNRIFGKNLVKNVILKIVLILKPTGKELAISE